MGVVSSASSLLVPLTYSCSHLSDRIKKSPVQRSRLLSITSNGKLLPIQELLNCGVSQQKTVLNTCGIGRAELTQRQLYVFMALLRVSRLRVSADPQVLKAA